MRWIEKPATVYQLEAGEDTALVRAGVQAGLEPPPKATDHMHVTTLRWVIKRGDAVFDTVDYCLCVSIERSLPAGHYTILVHPREEVIYQRDYKPPETDFGEAASATLTIKEASPSEVSPPVPVPDQPAVVPSATTAVPQARTSASPSPPAIAAATSEPRPSASDVSLGPSARLSSDRDWPWRWFLLGGAATVLILGAVQSAVRVFRKRA